MIIIYTLVRLWSSVEELEEAKIVCVAHMNIMVKVQQKSTIPV